MKKREFETSELKVEYSKGVETLFREPTKEEIFEALKLYRKRRWLEKKKMRIEKELEDLEKLAKNSKVFYDRAGCIYDFRTFIASGRIDFI